MSLIPLAELIYCSRPCLHPVAIGVEVEIGEEISGAPIINGTAALNNNSAAVLDNNATVTWETFLRDVSVLSNIFTQSNDKRWALAFDDSYLFLTAFMALCHSNKDIILPGNLQPAALNELLPHFDAIVHDNRITPPLNVNTLSLPISKQHSDHSAPLPPSFDNIRLILFTSGSSQAPKAIIKNLSQLQAELNQLESLWGDHISGTTILSTVSHQHIYGLLFRALWPLSVGRPFARHDMAYPESIAANADDKYTLISSPALLKRLTAPNHANAYRAIFSSGGPLPFDAVEDSERSLGQRPIEVYGSTETGGIGYRKQASKTTPWCLFNDITATLNAHGCLKILSPYIDPNHWYQTADLCELINDTQFMLNGRADRIIKIEEKRVSLLEIEQRLCETPWISDAASLVLSRKGRHIVSAAVVLSSQGIAAIKKEGKGKFQLALRQQLRPWLEPVAIPRQLRYVNAIPQNSQGKRQQQMIENLFKPELTIHK